MVTPPHRPVGPAESHRTTARPGGREESRRTADRLRRAVTGAEAISTALARTGTDPRALLAAVVRAVADQGDTAWLMLALADGALAGLRPRVLVLDPAGVLHEGADDLPAWLGPELAAVRAGRGEPAGAAPALWLPLRLDGLLVAALVGRSGRPAEPDPAAEAVLRMLAAQAAVSLHAANLLQAGRAPRGSAPVDRTPRHGELTEREQEVLRLLARGRSNRAIGQQLYISETTAKFHVGNIMRKLQVSRRAEAVYVASKAGVI